MIVEEEVVVVVNIIVLALVLVLVVVHVILVLVLVGYGLTRRLLLNNFTAVGYARACSINSFQAPRGISCLRFGLGKLLLHEVVVEVVVVVNKSKQS